MTDTRIGNHTTTDDAKRPFRNWHTSGKVFYGRSGRMTRRMGTVGPKLEQVEIAKRIKFGRY